MPVDMRSRHYQAAPRGPQAWKCPACGADNAGPLEQGCSSCHSGEPGSHVGVPPPAPKKMDDAATVGAKVFFADTPADSAYLAWSRETYSAGQYTDDVRQALYEAFKAGFQAGIGQVSQMATPLAGTAESRTVVAALRMFLENVLPTATEEIQTGEFLSIEATEALIQRLERTNG